jgi:hypothetical protein
MKKFKKIMLIFLGLVAVLGVSGYVYFNQQFPKKSRQRYQNRGYTCKA